MDKPSIDPTPVRFKTRQHRDSLGQLWDSADSWDSQQPWDGQSGPTYSKVRIDPAIYTTKVSGGTDV